jgi:ectoine hydroxylase-related dioxygenase (phytanoyl-CoA dioxygenase family)
MGDVHELASPHPAARIFAYDTGRYDFTGWAQQALAADDLAKLHDLQGNSETTRQAALTTLDAQYHTLRDTFRDFIGTVATHALGPLVAFQDPPIFRVHFPDTATVSAPHRDRDFSRADPGSPILRRNRNVWVPLTPVFGGCALWVESSEGAGDLAPIRLEPGQVLVFDGLNLLHGSSYNDTGQTRVSFEARCLPAAIPDIAQAGAR